jgi:hypothetical protein
MAKLPIMATAQRRARSSLHPSARSSRTGRVEPVPDERGRRRSTAALTRKVAASAASAQPGDDTARITPASAGPTICAALSAARSSEFADCNSSSATSVGTNPVTAGRENAWLLPVTSPTRTKIQISAVPVRMVIARTVWQTAMVQSAAIRMRRRSRRSPATPPARVSTSSGTMPRPSTSPRSAAEPLIASTANVTATGDNAPPSADTELPTRNARKCLLDNTASRGDRVLPPMILASPCGRPMLSAVLRRRGPAPGSGPVVGSRAAPPAPADFSLER